MLDQDGYRPNVGIVLVQAAEDASLGGNTVDCPSKSKLSSRRVLWARRVGGRNAWQFPQGGINEGESAECAVMRELYEEVGIKESAVKVLGQTRGWLTYDLPLHMRRNNSTPGFVGQKQKWFMLEIRDLRTLVRMDLTDRPEFDHFQWVSYYYPITKVVDFKRLVYRQALVELAQYLPNER
jgi:putative (di)nucleoside polyphosphate hydrolase